MPNTIARQATHAARSQMQGHRAKGFLLLLLGGVVTCGTGALPLVTDALLLRLLMQAPAALLARPWVVLLARSLGALLALLLALALCAPLRLGRAAWYFGGAQGLRRSAVRVLFWWQPKFACKAMRAMWALELRRCAWGLLYLSPGGVLLAGALWQATRAPLDRWLFVAALVGGGGLLLLGAGFYWITVQKYALTFTLLVQNPQISVRQALRQSSQHTQGRCKELVGLQLRLLPWSALCLLVLPLPFAATHIAATLATYCAMVARA